MSTEHREFDDMTAEALAACAAEPIRVPGAVQSHGVLLAVGPDGCVEQVSRTCARWLGHEPEAVIGKTLGALLGPEAERALARLAQDAPLVEPTPLRLPGRPGAVAVVHRSGDSLVLELEETEPHVPEAAAYARMLADLHGKGDLEGLTRMAAQEMRRESGYDRVMIYRFTAEGHGVVLAEDRRPDLAPFLGLHYPDSDIPAQARALYLQNRVRVLADVRGERVPLVPLLDPRGGRPLDMSHCALRAVSLVHVQYLENMGVRATLVASIIVDGALWGLIACHHYAAPKAPSPEMRRYADCLALLLAGRLKTLELQGTLRAQAQADQLGQEINRAAPCPRDWRAAVLDRAAPLLALLGSEGLVIAEGDELSACGLSPPAEQVREVLAWLRARPATPLTIEDALGRPVPALADVTACASGLLALHLAADPPTFLLCFRPEWTRQLRWAGHPHKQMVRDGQGRPRLLPRTSFEVFCETVSGQAQALTVEALAAAVRLRQHLVEAVLRSTMVHLRAAERDRDRVYDVVLHGPSPTVVVNEDGAVLLVNHAFRRCFGLGRERLEGAGGLRALVPRVLEAGAALREALAAGLPFRGDLLVQGKDGAARWTDVNLTGLTDEKGRWLGQVLALADISERKQAEAELRGALADAEAASRARRDILATVSHELQTPINGVLGMAALLLDAALPEELRQHAEAIRSCGEGLLCCVDDLLDSAQLEFGRMILDRVPFALNRLLSECVSIARPRAAERGLGLVEGGDLPGPAHFLGDPRRLRQIVLNLIGNAIKFTDSGQVTVTALHPPGGPLEIAVTDTGIGIAKEDLGRLFRKFGQLAPALRRRVGGLGLGLALSQGLAQRMGGRIEVESEPGRGSTFRLRVPLQVVPRGGVSLAPAAPVARARPPRVLVVEDDAVSRRVVEKLLRRLDCQVDLAEHGAAAVAMAARVEYDLIFMDCQMPEMDGFEATGRIRRGEAPPRRVPIVALTASAVAADRERCLAAGMDDHIGKPARSELLAGALRRWVRTGATPS